jgi:hypothetical protein
MNALLYEEQHGDRQILNGKRLRDHLSRPKLLFHGLISTPSCDTVPLSDNHRQASFPQNVIVTVFSLLIK